MLSSMGAPGGPDALAGPPAFKVRFRGSFWSPFRPFGVPGLSKIGVFGVLFVTFMDPGEHVRLHVK